MRTRKLFVSALVVGALVLTSAGSALGHGGNFDTEGRIDPTLPNCVGLLNSMHARDDGGIPKSIVARQGRHPGFTPVDTVKQWQDKVRVHCAQAE
jgi:hypothetical protein